MERLLTINEDQGILRKDAYLRVGIPFPKGRFHSLKDIIIVADKENALRFEGHPILHWPDGSIKWVHFDMFFDLLPNSSLDVFLSDDVSHCQGLKGVACGEMIKVEETNGVLLIDNGLFHIKADQGNKILINEIGLLARIILPEGNLQTIYWEDITLLHKGKLRVDVKATGHLTHKKKRINLNFILSCFYKNPLIVIEAEIHNPHAAIHPGGMWDLGDPGSVYIRDFSLILRWVFGDDGRIFWCDNLFSTPNERDPAALPLIIYQDSSGGELWDSVNHIDKDGRPTVSFRGYRVYEKRGGENIAIKEGRRANPVLSVVAPQRALGIGLNNFWENFPSALEVGQNLMRIGLFPKEAKGLFELQGGEKKRHTAYVSFENDDPCSHLKAVLSPIKWAYDPNWIASTQVIPYFVPEGEDSNHRYLTYIRRIIEGEDSFFKKREAIDEYGWRNFGDIYGDHEAVNHTGKDPFISHYNNQYDFVFGGLVHFLRSGDWLWWKLASELARHVVDIDIYHTDEDKPAYNHGLFWHTDHYKEAKTATHRCYSRHNETTGGGPCNEQNYTTGLLYHYLISGDRGSRKAILELAQWVIDMDDGEKGLFAVIDSGPTGLASSTADPLYHGPGRGAGNSINALMDTYVITKDRAYLFKAEELIRRTIHPEDCIERLGLDQPEYRWSYLVYLQVIAKYLELKDEWGEKDWMYFYARDSLLHYVRWMFENEVPYKDVLQKVEIPTETWPAQDIRKAYIFNVAAKYAPHHEKGVLLKKARFFFERCIDDVMSFDTAYVARPMVLLCVYGYVQSYFDKMVVEDLPEFHSHTHEFGQPSGFLPQRQRLRATLGRHMEAAAREVIRILKEKIYRILKR